MSFTFNKKNIHRTVGIISALCFTGMITLGFLQSYQQAKQRQVVKVDVVEVAIFADKPAAAPILYEAVPTEECIKQLTPEVFASSSSESLSLASSSTVSGVQFSSAPPVSSSPVTSATAIAKTSAAAVKKISLPPQPPLVSAKSPKCIAPSFVPIGYEKLGAEGFVTLQLNLAKSGRVERGEVEKSSGFAELDTAALTQVKNAWQFEPCKKAGKIVACKHRIRFRWEVK